MVLFLGACTLSIGGSSKSDGGVFISYTSGETWQAKVFVGQQEKRVVTIGGYDASFLAFDPKDTQTIYFVSRSNGIFRTTDGGERWESTTLNTGGYAALAIDPDNTSIMYAAQGGTVLKTVDGMKTWSTIYLETRPKQSVNGLAINPEQPNIIYATTQNSILKSEDFGTTWRQLSWEATQPTQRILISKRDPHTLYVYVKDYGFYKTTNDGETWVDISEGLQPFSGGKNALWIDFHPLTDRLTLGTNYGILSSTDGGITWTAVENIIRERELPIKTVVVNPANTREIYFTVRNVLYKTVDGGATWKTLDTIPTTRTIASLYVSPHDPASLLAGTEPPPK